MSALLGRQRAAIGGSHPDTLQLELNLAQVQLVLGDAATALATLTRIYPDFVAVFGPEHRLTVGLLGDRAYALEKLGRYNDAYTDQIQAYQIAARTDGPQSYVALGSLSDAAQSRCRAGRVDLGLGPARAANADAQALFGAASLLAQAVGGNLALCLIADSQFAAAAPLLDKIDGRLVGQMSMDESYGAKLDLMRAAICFAAGKLPEGRSLLAKASPAFLRAGADPYLRRWAMDLSGR